MSTQSLPAGRPSHDGADDAGLCIALWQTTGFPGDVPANLAALETCAAAAAGAGAQILLTPECWLGGYHIGDAVPRVAETRNGPSAARIADIARHHRVAIVYGYAERDAESGALYNAAQMIAPDGTAPAHYRKAHLWGAYERQYYQAGNVFGPPVSFGGFRVGLLICYDIEYPEAVRALALQGADLLLVPTALSCEFACVPDYVVPARAVENQIFVAYCNHAGEENGLRFLGGSCLVGVDGRAVARAGEGEALIIGEISQTTRRAALEVYSYVTDRRPELYGRLLSA